MMERVEIGTFQGQPRIKRCSDAFTITLGGETVYVSWAADEGSFRYLGNGYFTTAGRPTSASRPPDGLALPSVIVLSS